jgi:hypothetical protein
MKSNKFSISIILGALVAVAGSNVLASDKWVGDRGDNWEDHIKSVKSRNQVETEVRQARAQGLAPQHGGDRGENWENQIKSTRSRTDVIAEMKQARAQGLLNQRLGERENFILGSRLQQRDRTTSSGV